jgi:hypothetical protein
MTKKNDLKELVRARMAKTGEGYTAALRNVQAPRTERPPSVSLDEREWHPLLQTTREEAAALLTKALAREPRLCGFGIGLGAETQRRVEARMATGSEASVDAEFKVDREYLSENLQQVAACADWIKLRRVVATFNRDSTSYGYKHQVERWFNGRQQPYVYVANGSFIAAALGLGLDAKRQSPSSPNLYFKFSKNQVSGVPVDAVMKVSGAVKAPDKAPDKQKDIQYRTAREKAWRNLMVAGINAGLGAGRFTIEPNDNRWPTLTGGERPQDAAVAFELVGMPALAWFSDAGSGEVNVGVALNPTEYTLTHHGGGNGFDFGDAVAHGWLERERGAWLQSSTSLFACRRNLLVQLAEADIQPVCFGDRGRVM